MGEVVKKGEFRGWLYDSHGRPIAFVDEGEVFNYDGKFVGLMVGNQVLNGGYIGELTPEGYFLRNWNEPSSHPIIYQKRLTDIPAFPAYKAPCISIPTGFTDVDFGNGVFSID